MPPNVKPGEMVWFNAGNVGAIIVCHAVAIKNGLDRCTQLGIVLHAAIILAVLVGHAAAVNNGLARVPQMGWVRNSSL